MKIKIPISVGELLDKISILQIKSKYTDSHYVKQELEYLTKIAKQFKIYNKEYLSQLLNVNKFLWDIEDKLRIYEKNHNFNDDFIYNARMVYITNDERAKIKKEINEKLKSELHEIKIYNEK